MRIGAFYVVRYTFIPIKCEQVPILQVYFFLVTQRTFLKSFFTCIHDIRVTPPPVASQPLAGAAPYHFVAWSASHSFGGTSVGAFKSCCA